MQSKLLVGALFGAGVVGLGTFALGMAQQPISGELDPPAGPVGDTTPSLAAIEAKLDALAMTASPFPPGLRAEQFDLPDGGISVLGSESELRLYAISISEGAAQALDSGGDVIAEISGSSIEVPGPGQRDFRGTSQQLLGGIRVSTPLTLLPLDNGVGERVTLYFWIQTQ